MDPLLVVGVALALILFMVTAYMEWLGLASLTSWRSGARHPGCGHRKLTPANGGERCWWCRHERVEHALHIEPR